MIIKKSGFRNFYFSHRVSYFSIKKKMNNTREYEEILQHIVDISMKRKSVLNLSNLSIEIEVMNKRRRRKNMKDIRHMYDI